MGYVCPVASPAGVSVPKVNEGGEVSKKLSVGGMTKGITPAGVSNHQGLSDDWLVIGKKGKVNRASCQGAEKELGKGRMEGQKQESPAVLPSDQQGAPRHTLT